jgi:uncharacterized protein (TIGR04255 family)
MSERSHLAKAPIAEAILDIRAVLPAATRLRQLDAMHLEIREDYPNRRTRKRIKQTFDVRGEGEVRLTKHAPTEDGFLFQSRDGKRIVQARLDGFTFNQLKPYSTWDTFRDEAKQHWHRYIDIAHPESVQCIALRYINRMELPLPIGDFKEYVLTAPEIGRGIPSAVSNMFLRLSVPYPDGALAIITETLEPPEKRSSGEILPFILDIDVIRNEPSTPPFADIWEKFEELRRRKNDIFFNTITRKAEALFQ